MTLVTDGLTRRRLTQALSTLADVQFHLDQERLERAQAEALLERLFGSLSDAVLVIDPRGQVTRANRAAEELFARPVDVLAGCAVEMLYRDAVPVTPWALLDVAPSGQLSLETAAVAADGTVRDISLSCAIVRDPDGSMQGVLHAARDLSEVHRLLHQVESAEARWRLLEHVSNQLAGALDPHDALDPIVTHLERVTGHGAAVVLSQDGVVTRVAVSPMAPNRSALTTLKGAALPAGSAVASVIATGQPLHAATMEPDFPLLGHGVHGYGSAVVLPLEVETAGREGGVCAGALLVVADLSEAVDAATVALMEEVATRMGLSLANATLRDTLVEHRAAEEAAHYRDEILAAISHDMKTPLSVLLGMVALLGRSQPGDGDAEIRDSMERQVRRLRRLVIQFLDYIRLEAGHELSVAPKPTDLAAVLEAAKDVEGGSGRVRIDAPARLPMVIADEGRTELALANLVTNAVKYASAGTPVTIEVREVGRHVEVSVIDEGPGIAPADQARLFERFHRGGWETGVEGTGLGLYMTRQLMRSQGGEVRVASRVGAGSRFTLTLRRADGGTA